MPLDAGYLGAVGKLDIVIDLGAGPYPSDIQSTVTLLTGFMVREKKFP